VVYASTWKNGIEDRTFFQRLFILMSNVTEIDQRGGMQETSYNNKGIGTMYQDRIELNPKICAGKPVIKGTRIPVSVIISHLAAGETWKELITGFPELTEEDIKAALQYASDSIEHTEIMFASK